MNSGQSVFFPKWLAVWSTLTPGCATKPLSHTFSPGFLSKPNKKRRICNQSKCDRLVNYINMFLCLKADLQYELLGAPGNMLRER